MNKLLSCFLILGVLALSVQAEETKPVSEEAIRSAVQVEDAFAAVVDMAKPAVVVITNKQAAPQMSEQMQALPPEFFRFFGFPQFQEDEDGGRGYGRRPQRRQRVKPRPQPVGKGSGVIVDGEGYILTNCHVIADNDYLEIKTSDGTVYDNEKDADAVKVIGMDEETDLAILQIGNGKKKDFPYLKFADSEKIRVGQWAIAIGAPFNFDYSVTIGCVSQKGRYDTGMSTFENYIQTDASINPGNSGGPLLNIHGEIIGINQFIFTGGMSKGSIGLGFAIASNMAKQVADGLINNGEIARPFIGVSMQELSDELKKQFNVESGVLVSEAIKGEGAEKAGIEAGDVIQKVGDQIVMSAHDLMLAVTKYHPGDEIPITVLRDGKEKVFKVKAGTRKDANGKSRKNSGKSKGRENDESLDDVEAFEERLGITLKFDDEKAIVTSIAPDGLAARAVTGDNRSLAPGDIILSINRREIEKGADVVKALRANTNNTILLYVERRLQGGSMKFFLPILLDEEK